MSATPWVSLRDVVASVDTWTPSRDEPSGSFTYIDLSAVDQEGKVVSEPRVLPCKEAPSRARQIVNSGDVLVSTVRPNLNGVARVPTTLHGATASTGFCVLRPRKEKLEGGYLFYWVQTPAFIEEMVRKATGANYPAVSDRIVLESKLPVPTLSEQVRLTAILDMANALRTNRRTAIALLDTLTESIFLEMFGDPTINDSHQAFLPLEAVVSRPLQNGAYFPKESYCVDGGVEMVHMSDAFYGTVVPGRLKRVAGSKEDVEKYSLTSHDLLIARRSLNYEGAAKPCLIPKLSEPLIFESSFIRVTPDTKKLSIDYLFNYLGNERVRRKFVQPFITQSTISGINQTNLSRVPVMVPPLELQRLFSQRVAAVGQQRHLLEKSLSATALLFASLQHRAFNGTV